MSDNEPCQYPEEHEAHMHMNGECPWCGAYEPERATGEMPDDA